MRKPFVATLLIAMVWAPAAAIAQTYPPMPRPTCDVSDHSVNPGDTVGVFGGRWSPPSVTVRFFEGELKGPKVVAAVDAEAHNFDTEYTIPADAYQGLGHFLVRGRARDGQNFTCVVDVRVLGVHHPTAFSEPAGLTVGGMLLAVFGVLAIYLMVRRRTRMRNLTASR